MHRIWRNAYLKALRKESEINKNAENTSIYSKFLNESKRQTLSFYKKVKEIIEEEIEEPNKTFENFYRQNMIAEYYWKLL